MGLFRRKETKPETTVSVHSEIVDASGTDLGEQIRHTLAEHGIEQGENRVIDASTVPGLTEEIFGALEQSGVWQHAMEGATFSAPAAPVDPVAQLAQLAELHRKGHLSDLQFETAKQKLLNENWDQPPPA